MCSWRSGTRLEKARCLPEKWLILHPRDAPPPCGTKTYVGLGLPHRSDSWAPCEQAIHFCDQLIFLSNEHMIRHNAENCCVMPFSCQNTAVISTRMPETSCNASYKMNRMHRKNAHMTQKSPGHPSLRLAPQCVACCHGSAACRSLWARVTVAVVCRRARAKWGHREKLQEINQAIKEKFCLFWGQSLPSFPCESGFQTRCSLIPVSCRLSVHFLLP